MSLGVLNQQEYLKKYLNKKNSTSKGKKKKKKISSKSHGFSVVDESLDLKDIPFGCEENDCAPTVAEVTYENEKAKLIDEFQANKKKWKSLGSDDIDENEIKIEENEQGLFSIENKIKPTLFSKSSSVDDSLKSVQSFNSSDRQDTTRERDHSYTPPSRRKRHDSDMSHPYRKRHDSDSSPVHQKKHSTNMSPSRRKRCDYAILPSNKKMHDSNTSPRRKTHTSHTSPLRKRRPDSDKLSSRRNRHDSDSSPTRPPRRNRSDSDTSPPRRKRHDSDTSLPEQKMNDYGKSSPRLKKRDAKISPSERSKHHLNISSPQRKKYDSDTLPSRRRNDSDTSPPRRRKGDSDTSPRRKRNYSDKSPPRRRKYDSDTSPPRRRKDDSDTSPPRRRKYDSDTSPLRRRKDDSDTSPPRRKIHGDPSTNASSRLKHNFGSTSHHFENCDSGASQIWAPKKGNNSSEYPSDMSLSSFSKRKVGEHFKAAGFKKIKGNVPKELSEEDKILVRKLEEKYQKWNKGIVQDQKHKEAVDYAIHEMGKSFARTADDEDMNRSLKNVMRQEDPMLEYIAKKESKRNTHSLKPRYVGSFPANRFNIAPGYRWDGVDRSNGYEKEWFIKKSSKRATEDESYKWSTEDM